MLIGIGKYDPYGKQFLEKHPHLIKESVTDPIIDFSKLLDPSYTPSRHILFHKLFSVSDSLLITLGNKFDERNILKQGNLKNIAIQTEQEIYVHGSTVVWSRKGNIVKSFNYDDKLQSIKTILFAWFPINKNKNTIVKDTSDIPLLKQRLESCNIPAVYDADDHVQKRALCIVFEDHIRVHFEDGLEYTTHIPFEIDNVIPLDVGLLVSKKPSQSEETRRRDSNTSHSIKTEQRSKLTDKYIYSFMTVKHPLRGPCPIRLSPGLQHVTSKSFRPDSSHKLLFATTESQLPIIVTFNMKDKAHYLWTYKRRNNKTNQQQTTLGQKEEDDISKDKEASVISISSKNKLLKANMLPKKIQKKGKIMDANRKQFQHFPISEYEDSFYDNELERGLYNALIDRTEISVKFLWRESLNTKIRKRLAEFPNIKTEAFMTHNLQGQELICILNHSINQLQVIDIDKIMNEVSCCVIFKAPAVSAIPINATRDQFKDLLYLDVSKQAHLFIDATVTSLPIHFHDNIPQQFSDPVFERFNVHFESGEIRRYQFNLRPKSSLVLNSFAAVGCVSTTVFAQLWRHFIQYYRLTSHDTLPTEWESFFVALLSLIHIQRLGQTPDERHKIRLQQIKVSNNNIITKEIGFLPETLRIPLRWIDQLSPTNTIDVALFVDIIRSLHVLFEEYRIKKTTREQAKKLGYLLMQCSVILDHREWIDYYKKQGIKPEFTIPLRLIKQSDSIIFSSLPPPPPPNIELCLQLMATASNTALLSFFGVSTLEPMIGYCQHNYAKTIKQLWILYGILNEVSADKSLLLNKMVEYGIMLEEIKDLVYSLASPILEALESLKENPAVDWNKEVYLILDRDDIYKQLENKSIICDPNSSTFKFPASKNSGIPRTMMDVIKVCRENSEGSHIFKSDLLDIETERLRFGRSGYIDKVHRMLDAKCIPDLTVPELNLSDEELAAEHQSRVLMLVQRTLALSTGRAIYAFATHLASPIKPLPFEPITLAAKILPLRTIVNLDDVINKDSLQWPLFHNGVASGLRISANSNVTDSWINFCFPDNTVIESQHGGLLLAMGLNGTIKHSPSVDWYRFVMQEAPDIVTSGILLGAAAAYKGTKDPTLTKVLQLHIPVLFPPDSHSFNHSNLIQAASVLGMGLVYMGKCERSLVLTMLEEISKNAMTDPSILEPDYEAYSLSAGFSLGMITLGQGPKAITAVDSELLNTLFELMKLNADITAPGATIALGLMYLKTNDRAVANSIMLLEKRPYLNYVRPDILLLRVLAKYLILWDDIEPTKSWIDEQLPDFMTEDDEDAILQAKYHIIAGVCLCLGLKFAGTNDNDAFKCLLEQLDYFKQLLNVQATTIQGNVTKYVIQTCVNVLCTACAMVMAGSGNRDLFDRLESLWSRTETMTYGDHMAISMSLGLLYAGLGGYTLKTTNESIAALLCAFYPFYPMDTEDNRYHMQLFRHLWVLALDSRWLVPFDVTSRQPCRLPLEVKLDGKKVRIAAPTVIPDYNQIKEIKVMEDRYWPLKVDMTVKGDYQRSITQSGILYVKRKKNKKSYEEVRKRRKKKVEINV
ncbi:uncharacterized protein BX663DRAFT_445000 [Cokeromyces recurvatus]|uniref:uncharacterized protein n=1 Tax=Cokeromyces recurvatus TaxID=90255 RepID=UPI002220334C|nr:uncharacterized protein BX663DRAFT_445000 [Cokeromyces recurvatus]KAI7897497.1 hypothetical protein BX663DRAFT_445000 [Cokeromyces recurvatus]